jgi:beta-galactoside alpha2,6-sialyltransferase (sialyltransferase 2)
LVDDDDLDRLSASMSRAFLYRLWKGNVSSRMLNPRLQKAMRDYVAANKHGVRFRGPREARRSRAELLCELRRRGRVRTLDGTEAPFSALGWRPLVPAVPLGQLHPRGLRSCAVVMSAGAILNSSLGQEIGASHGGMGARLGPGERVWTWVWAGGRLAEGPRGSAPRPLLPP